MVGTFKNRGHYCNYCRKILCNKVKGKDFFVININEVIWYGWDHPEHREEILNSIIALDSDCTNKQFNNQLRTLIKKYGFTSAIKPDRKRKRDYAKKMKEEVTNDECNI